MPAAAGLARCWALEGNCGGSLREEWRRRILRVATAGVALGRETLDPDPEDRVWYMKVRWVEWSFHKPGPICQCSQTVKS